MAFAESVIVAPNRDLRELRDLAFSEACEPALGIYRTSASNSDQVVPQQATGHFEDLRRIPWSRLPADMISKPGQSRMPIHTPPPIERETGGSIHTFRSAPETVFQVAALGNIKHYFVGHEGAHPPMELVDNSLKYFKTL
jgi:hypothetical protein